MPNIEKSAGVQLELKDLDTSKRSGVIKHAVYTSIDRVQDISTKGMFTKSWNEGMPKFYFNHDKTKQPGKALSVYDDNEGAYTQVKFANTTLGNDVLEMADEGMLEGASFGYHAEKKQFIEVKGQRVRKLLEVKHLETSLLDVAPCHPEAGLITFNKALSELGELDVKMLSESEQGLLQRLLLNDQTSLETLVALMGTIQPDSDLYTWIGYQVSYRADRMSSIMSQLKWNTQQMQGMKSHVQQIETYCHKAKASDETIILLQNQVQEYKNIISQYDTATTPFATEPGASDDEVKAQLSNFITTLNIETWKKQLQNS